MCTFILECKVQARMVSIRSLADTGKDQYQYMMIQKSDINANIFLSFTNTKDKQIYVKFYVCIYLLVHNLPECV